MKIKLNIGKGIFYVKIDKDGFFMEFSPNENDNKNLKYDFILSSQFIKVVDY